MRIRVAAAQWEIRAHDVEANLRAAHALADEAARKGARLIVFPETFLTGPIDTATDLIDGRNRLLERWQAIARAAAIDIVTGSAIVGTSELRSNRTYYVDKTGQVLGHHDKAFPWKTETNVVAGTGVTVVDAGFCRVGLAVCWDITSPALFAALAAAGADIVAVPAYWCRALTGPEVRHSMTAEVTHIDALCTARAFENSIGIIFANAAGPSFPPEPLGIEKRLAGRSQITIPFAGAVERAGSGNALLIADIELDILADARSLYGLGGQSGAANASS